MFSRSLISAVLLSGLVAVLGMQPGEADARGWKQSGEHRDESFDRALSQARKRGRVLSAETDESRGRRTHKFRVLNDKGQVRRLRIDADTGRVIERQYKDSDDDRERGRGRGRDWD